MLHGFQACYSFVQHWHGKKVSEWAVKFKIDKDEVGTEILSSEIHVSLFAPCSRTCMPDII